MICSLVFVLSHCALVFHPSNRTVSTTQDWMSESSWINGTVPCSQENITVDFVVDQHDASYLYVDSSFVGCSFSSVEFGSSTSLASLRFQLSPDVTIVFNSSSIELWNSAIWFSPSAFLDKDFKVVASAMTVHPKEPFHYVGPSSGFKPIFPKGAFEIGRLELQGSLALDHVNLTCKDILYISAGNKLLFAGASLKVNQLVMDESAELQFVANFISFTANSVTGGSIISEGYGTILGKPKLKDMFIGGDETSSSPFTIRSDGLRLAGNVSFSYVTFTSMGTTSEKDALLVAEKGSHVSFLSQNFIRVKNFAFLMSEGSLFRVESFSTLEIDNGLVSIDGSRFSMEHFSGILVQSLGTLSLTNVHAIEGDTNSQFGDSTITISRGTMTLSLYSSSVDTFRSEVAFEMYGGSLLCSGVYPKQISLYGGINLFKEVQFSQVDFRNAQVYISDLNFLGGRVFATVLAVSKLKLYSGQNSISSETTTIDGALMIRSSDMESALEVEGDLVLANHSAFIWQPIPSSAPPLSISGTLYLMHNVVLNMSHVSTNADDLSTFTVIKASAIVGTFGEIDVPNGWTVVISENSVELTQIFQPVSSISNTVETTTPTALKPKFSYVPIIIGCSVGGGVLIVIVILIVVALRRVKKSRDKSRYLNLEYTTEHQHGEMGQTASQEQESLLGGHK